LLINIDEAIIKYSENDIYQCFILPYYEKKHEEIVFGDPNYFIEFLKENHMFSDIICSKYYNNGKLLLYKLVNIFRLYNTDIFRLYSLIKSNATCYLIRTTDWQIYDIPIINGKAIKCYFADYKYINNWSFESERKTYKIFWLFREYSGNKIK
jgi:hypothetical protein